MGDYDYEDEEADEEVEEIRTLDTKKEMVRIRAEKKLTLARVKRLLRESEDLLEFDIDAISQQLDPEGMRLFDGHASGGCQGSRRRAAVPLILDHVQA